MSKELLGSIARSSKGEQNYEKLEKCPGGGHSRNRNFLKNLFFSKISERASGVLAREGEAWSFSRQGDAVPDRRCDQSVNDGSEQIFDLTGGFKRVKTKIAFTLAEVLITLAIIGIVAALTIPTVIANYNKHAQYTAFMKMYNTISNALSLSEADFGTPNNWQYDRNNRSQVAKTYIYPYLKVATMCADSDCPLDYEYKYLNHPDEEEGIPASEIVSGGNIVILQDGSLLSLDVGGSDIIEHSNFIFDTNGPKGPNVLGRDLFVIYYEKDRDSGKWDFNFHSYPGDTYCDPDDGEGPGGSGLGCSARLLEKGKMDY